MIKFNSLRQYTQKVENIMFPVEKNSPFFIVYMSENSTFIKDYKKLNLRLMDIRNVVVPVTKIPRTYLKPDERKEYRDLNLFVYSSNQKVPSGKNVIFDISKYLQLIDKKFKPTNYRQRVGSLIKNMILKSFSTYPKNYQKVLLYSVNSNEPLNSFINRKIFPIIRELKDGVIPFDHMLFNVIGETTSYYRLLVKNKTFNLQRVMIATKNVKTITSREEEVESAEQASDIVSNKISNKIKGSSEDKNKVKGAIQKYLETDEETRDRVNANQVEPQEYDEIATAAILSSTSGNLYRAKDIAEKIPKDKKDRVLKAISKSMADELLPPVKTTSTSEIVSVQEYDIAKAVDNKSPEHIFEKRKIDFEKNLKKDITNSFNVLKNKELPLILISIEIVDKPSKKGELYKSDESTVIVKLKDKFNKIHEILIDIPKIHEDGTFTVNGRKKCLINQIILLPVSFPKQYDAKFESFFSAFHIHSKRTKREKYLQIYMTYKLPLLVVLSFAFGFDETLKRYKIKYSITENKPGKDIKFFNQLDDKKYIIYENIDSELKEELVYSLVREDISQYKITKPFPSKEFFSDLIYEMTGRVNATYHIQNNVDNIVDPVSRQVLLNKQLPYDLASIIEYMSKRVVEGYKEDRNDLGSQRIRNSEILVHFVQKAILASYTVYKEQVLSGNKNADFEINKEKILRDFINSQVVVDMEYANPIEEMSTKTRISPVGKNIGGIPDTQALQNEARNVHNSYFGNVDPLDTPEGANVGIVQHLTVDALITSSRGLFKDKKITNDENSGLLSTSSSLIPFVENNDGARVMFGANQSRQSIPLKNPEPPAVQTGYESILTSVLSDSFIKRSPCNGKVTKVTDDVIVIECKVGGKNEIDITPVHLRSGSGKNTLSVFNPKVKVGQVVKEKQIVAEGSCISQGSISLGRTLLTAVMPYKGYNFEDGIVISEKLANSGKLTSLHGIEVEVLVSEKDRVKFVENIGKDTKKGDVLVRKTIGEVEELIGFEEDEDEEISSGQFIKKSPGGKIVDIEVFSNVKENKFPQLDDLIKRTNKKYNKPGGEKFSIKGETIKGVLIKFKIEQELPIGVGDKMTNRHGAKGIISLIEKDENMPVTPWGERVEIIVNPIGIISRMNVGQLYELYAGLISKELANKIIKLNNKDKAVSLLSKVLPLLDKSKDKSVSSIFIKNFKGMSPVKFKELINQMKESGNMTLVIPPFKSPNNSDLINALKVLGLKTKYTLKLPEFNTSTKSEVPVGYMYFMKLEHIGSEKVHGRSTGPVTGKTGQPTAGKSREGGQRMGELDTYSFISYNALTLLSESFGALSDDKTTKDEILSDVIKFGDADYKTPKSSPVRDLLNYYFTGLMLEKE